MTTSQLRIQRLYLSPGHNFIGHHGLPPGEHRVVEVAAVRCLAGRGLEGDRYLDHQESYKGQITFFAEEVWERLCERFEVTDRGPDVFRRNVLTRGQDLNELIGQEFSLQGVHFLGTEECRPCYWMDRAFCEGAFSALRGWGGLRAQILSDGVLQTAK